MSRLESSDLRSSSSDGGPDGGVGISVAPITDRAVLLSLDGKLQGRRARLLGERLGGLADEGIARVVLDLRSMTSIDSLGVFALEEGLNRGLRVHIVVRPSFVFDDFFASRSLGRRGLRVHRTLDEAIARVRQLLDTTTLV